MANYNLEKYSYSIPPWMSALKLTVQELLVYAVINDWCVKEGVYEGGLSFLCKWTNTSKTAVIRALNGLTEKGLIKKGTPEISNGIVPYRLV